MAHLSDFHRTYWSAFQDMAEIETSGLPKAIPSKSYMIFPVGVGGAHLAASVLVSRNLVNFYLLIQGKHRDEMFAHLHTQKAKIELDLRDAPVWTISSNANRARVTVQLSVDDLDNRKDWPRQHRWIIEKAKNFEKAFSARLHDLRGTL